jgi:hypothetical protein
MKLYKNVNLEGLTKLLRKYIVKLMKYEFKYFNLYSIRNLLVKSYIYVYFHF